MDATKLLGTIEEIIGLILKKEGFFSWEMSSVELSVFGNNIG